MLAPHLYRWVLNLLELRELVSASPPLPASLRFRGQFEKADRFEGASPNVLQLPT